MSASCHSLALPWLLPQLLCQAGGRSEVLASTVAMVTEMQSACVLQWSSRHLAPSIRDSHSRRGPGSAGHDCSCRACTVQTRLPAHLTRLPGPPMVLALPRRLHFQLQEPSAVLLGRPGHVRAPCLSVAPSWLLPQALCSREWPSPGLTPAARQAVRVQWDQFDPPTPYNILLSTASKDPGVGSPVHGWGRPQCKTI